MDSISLTRLALPALALSFFALALVRPVLRLRRRWGTWGITVHEKRMPVQRAVGAAMTASLVGMGAWVFAYAALGPEPLGVVRAPLAVTLAGLCVMLLGIAITVVAQLEMGASWRIGVDEKPTALVTSGLFRVVRNPIFSAVLAVLTGLALATPSPWTLMALLHAITIIAIQTRLEEQHLLALHGDAYRAYASKVGRFLPGIGRLERERE